jgi:hypothetical protein
VCQWALSFSYPLWFLFASGPAIMGRVLGIVCRVKAPGGGELTQLAQTVTRRVGRFQARQGLLTIGDYCTSNR